MIVSYYIIDTNHFDRPGIKATICNYKQLLLPVSALNIIVHNIVVLKTVEEKFSFSEFKIDKAKFFTQSPTKVYCISLFSKLLNFQTIFNVRPLATWLLIKNVYCTAVCVCFQI